MGIPPAPRGIPQIEVTFDIDANGILHVTAEDKSTGKSNKIIIRNDKGRLSKAEIDRMINEADKFKAEDDRQRERVQSKNQLEHYAFSIKQTLDNYGNRMSVHDKENARKAVDDCLRWIEQNQLADKEEIDYRMNELQRVCSPIMSKLHQGGTPQGTQDGPKVEEVD